MLLFQQSRTSTASRLAWVTDRQLFKVLDLGSHEEHAVDSSKKPARECFNMGLLELPDAGFQIWERLNSKELY